MERPPDQRPRPAQDHDARRRRVHPPLAPARPAEPLPPHPPLRPLRRRGSSAQHRAPSPICSPASTPPRESERAEADNETETPPTARRRPGCGGRMIIIDPFEGARAPRNRHRQPGSESTSHDRRRASRRATSIALPSSRAPEPKSADLVTSEDPLRPLRQRQTRTGSRPKRRVFVAGPVTIARRRAAPRRRRSAGDVAIPGKAGGLGLEPLEAAEGVGRGPLNLEPPKAACQRQRFICSSL